jgi:hypothetical protein
MGSDFWRDYPRNPREFEGWLRANTVLGLNRPGLIGGSNS